MLTTLVLLFAAPTARAACTVSRPYPPATLSVPQTTGGAAMFRVAASADCERLELSSGSFSTEMVGSSVRLSASVWRSLVGARDLTFTWTVTAWDAAGVATHLTTTNEIDSDHDGWTRTDGDLGTCDRDATHNPAAMDLCDGIDANCDGFETCEESSLSDADAIYTGEHISDQAGYSIAGAGDVNGDGYADVLVGAFDNEDGGTAAGAAYLVLGRASPGSASLSRAVEYTGESSDVAGFSVAGAGDVDGDGFDDVIVGAPRNSDAASHAGAVYLLLGRASPASASLSSADATYTGVAADDTAGISIAGAGDVNGDGYGDVLVGAWWNDDGADLAGAAYLVLGGPSPTGGSLSTADAAFTGESYGDQVGVALAGAGDVDGDGYDDMLVGATGTSSAGAAYLLLGAASPASASTSSADAMYSGPAADSAGNSVAGAGDVDGDGYDDVLIGAPADSDVALYAGVAYLVLGTASPVSASLSSADAKYTGDREQGYAGSSVAGAGDVDSDGYADLLVGTRVDVGNSAHLVLGAPSPASGSLSTANATYTGESSDDLAGSVAGAGDVDGDGYDDVLVGAYSNDDRGHDAGAAYLLLRGGL